MTASNKIEPSIDGAAVADDAAARPSRGRIRAHAEAGRADGADAARADRDDDDRSRAASAGSARRRSPRRRWPARSISSASPSAWAGVGGGAARRAGLRRARPAPGAARACASGCGPRCLISLPMMVVSALRRTDPAGARTGAKRRASRAEPICSASSGASRPRCGSSPSAASWARSTGPSRCCGSRWPRSRPTRCWSISLIYGECGAAAARPVRRRARHHDRQFRHVPCRAVVCRRAPAVLEYHVLAQHLAHRLGD